MQSLLALALDRSGRFSFLRIVLAILGWKEEEAEVVRKEGDEGDGAKKQEVGGDCAVCWLLDYRRWLLTTTPEGEQHERPLLWMKVSGELGYASLQATTTREKERKSNVRALELDKWAKIL